MEKSHARLRFPYATPAHFGHIAGAYLRATAMPAFPNAAGNDVLYICGSDEHGVAITLSAEMAGRSPKQHVDHFHKILKDFFTQLEFSFDHYSRTTWKDMSRPPPNISAIFSRTASSKSGSRSSSIPNKITFLADRYVVGTCPKCGYCRSARR